MIKNLSSVEELNSELEKVMINFEDYHTHMRQSRLFYKQSAFYEKQAGQSNDREDIYQNLLQVFADKNIEYTSTFPTIKVPTTGSEDWQRQAASIREKILYATHRANNTELLRKKWAYDATIFSIAVAETSFDIEQRCVKIKRYDPRKVYWQYSNDNDGKVVAFWAVFAITADEAEREYGVRPTTDMISSMVRSKFSRALDGKEWFTMAIRWDAKTRVKWVGDKLIEEPHNHLQGEIPIDMCAPIEEADEDYQYPGFYLDPLIPLQANLNDSFYRRTKTVRRMSSPLVWVRGVPAGKRLDDIKAEMSNPGGGVLGLSAQGEAGLLQLNENRMLNDQEDRIVTAMTRIAGYGNAAFGENVGANTSGDALGMYFNATQRKIAHQYISWNAFDAAINAKILRLYDKFLKPGETIQLDGYAPRGTVSAIDDGEGGMTYRRDAPGFDITFDKTVIAGNYTSVVIPPTATPKNELEEKRLAIQAVQQKFLSRTTAYEVFGILSPEDELKLLEAEQRTPALNPDGVSSLISAAQSAMQPGGLDAASSMADTNTLDQ